MGKETAADTRKGVTEAGGRMKRVFGFNSYELSSWRSFVRLMSSPRDPSSLAAWRIMFGE